MRHGRRGRRPSLLPALLLVLIALAARSPLFERLEADPLDWLTGHRFEVALGAAAMALVLWLEAFGT